VECHPRTEKRNQYPESQGVITIFFKVKRDPAQDKARSPKGKKEEKDKRRTTCMVG